MPRACSLLRLLQGDIIVALILFLPIELLCRSRKKHIAATIKRRLYGVLDDTYDGQDRPRPTPLVRRRRCRYSLR